MNDNIAAGATAQRRWTCPFCPLACDHLGVDSPDSGAPSLRGGECPRASRALASFDGLAATAAPTRDGIACTLDDAVATAAGWLAAGRQPLFGGLGTDVAGARALYRLACATGAICDPGGGDALMAGLRPLQDRGQFTTTLAEVRTRADVIVFVGGLPIDLAPLEMPVGDLVATGLTNRPELAASRALVCEAVNRLQRWAQTRLPALKLFVCGGASVPPSIIREAANYLERAVVTRVYGSTEVPVTTVGVTARDDLDHAADTDGRPGIATVKLAGASGSKAARGEVLARGPQMLVGYVHPGDEASVFDQEGYYHTGDLGCWADDDYLVIAGRLKDIIIRNGENIAPKEVEDLLLGHPDIAEIAIVGLPDPRTGERACAVIVPSGVARPDVASLRGFLEARNVARFKIPEQVVLRDALPKNDAGKVLKHRIRDSLLIESS